MKTRQLSEPAFTVSTKAHRRIRTPAESGGKGMVAELVLPQGLAEPENVEEFDIWLDNLSYDVEPIHDLIAALIGRYSSRDPREQEILAARFGLDGDLPPTLAELGAVYGVTRERIRQLQERATATLIKHSLAAEDTQEARSVLTARYGPGQPDMHLVHRLTLETCATNTERSAKSLVNLKLQLAGHTDEAAKTLSAHVATCISWLRRRITELQRTTVSTEERATAHLTRWLDHVDWAPATTRISPLPTQSARLIDLTEEGKYSLYLDKVHREVLADSRFEQRFLRILNASSLIETFQEQPLCIGYQHKGRDRSYYPDLILKLADGRVILVEVKRVAELAYAKNQAKFAAARTYAHQRGWGWLVWTAAASIPELLSRTIAPDFQNRLTALVQSGNATWYTIRELEKEGLHFLDLVSLTLRNQWRWERTPFRLSPAS